MDTSQAIEKTRTWISRLVIGLNLCPFARRVFDADLIRYVVCQSTDRHGLSACLAEELNDLIGASPTGVETTLIIHPNVLSDFGDYNDFFRAAERIVRKMKLDQDVQLASFHPDYQFNGVQSEPVDDFSNRSPFPMLHLLRVESVARVTQNESDADLITDRNIATLRKLGVDGVKRLMSGE